MDLLVDTTQYEKIILALFLGSKEVKKEVIKVERISERLLSEIEKFLKKNKVRLKELKSILVNPGPGGFSATRTGVAIANALAYALGIPVAEYPSGKVLKFVLPEYDKEPNITRSKK